MKSEQDKLELAKREMRYRYMVGRNNSVYDGSKRDKKIFVEHAIGVKEILKTHGFVLGENIESETIINEWLEGCE